MNIISFNNKATKIALGSFFQCNFKNSYSVTILGDEDEDLKKFLSLYTKNIKFKNIDLLEALRISDDETNIFIHPNSLTLKPIEDDFSWFSQFQMVGQTRYWLESELWNEGLKIPFVSGIFSDGFVMFNKLYKPDLEQEYINRFCSTFKIERNHKDFEMIFLSWLCIKKLAVTDISAESKFFHSTTVKDLRHIYFSDNPDNLYPWSVDINFKLPYIFEHLNTYYQYAEKFKCSFAQLVKRNSKMPLMSFEQDFRRRFEFRSWRNVFIPPNERNFEVSLY
jgi:hypothetical protein